LGNQHGILLRQESDQFAEREGDTQIEHFVGTLRVVDYRRGLGQSLSTASVGSREELADLLGRPWLVGPGGLMLVVGEEDRRVTEAAEAFGFEAVAEAGAVELYRKARPVFREEAESADYATGYAEGWNYLVTYRDPARAGEVGPPESGLEAVFSRGWATVYRRAS